MSNSPRVPTYNISELYAAAQVRDGKTTTDAYGNFLAVNKALNDAKAPTDGRVMYYLKLSWWLVASSTQTI